MAIQPVVRPLYKYPTIVTSSKSASDDSREPVKQYSQPVHSIPSSYQHSKFAALVSKIEDEDDEEDGGYSVDSVTYMPLTMPVIDSCGHTLNRTTFTDLPRVVNAEGVEDPNLVLCPLSRQPVRIDRLIRNMYARDARCYMQAMRERTQAIVAELRTENVELRRIREQLEENNINLREQNKKLDIRNRDLELRNIKLEGEVQNLLDMSLCDRMQALVYPPHLEIVKGRKIYVQRA